MFIGSSPKFVKEKLIYSFNNNIHNLLKLLHPFTDLMNR
jgi:hypothetical protein